MRKAKSLLGLKIVTQTEGRDLGTVRDLIFSDQSQRLIALLLTDRDLFGMIDATAVPWNEIRQIGRDALMVTGENAVTKVHGDAILAEAFDARNSLDGKQITTDGGENLGHISDLYIDDSGHVLAYEVSGGLFSNIYNGKRYLERPVGVTVGEDAVIVPHGVIADLERQTTEQPGGMRGTLAAAGEKVGGVYDSAKEKATETYGNIASASVDKQRAFVIGKVAGRDVIIPAQKATTTTPPALAVEGVESGMMSPTDAIVATQLQRETPATAIDVSSSGEVVDGEVLVRKGEIISETHADRAISAGILGQLVTAATLGGASGALASGQQSAQQYGEDTQNSLEARALGNPAGREVDAPDGSIIVAPGQIITRNILDRADAVGKKNEVLASAGLGAASTTAQDTFGQVKDTAGNLFGSLKDKVAELTGTAHEKKADYDAAAQEKKIKNALGRPVTRVILAQDDAVILNTGDIVTNKAISRAREENSLDILLDSIYEADPDITPEMLRVTESGEAALPTQAQPTGGPITATVVPEQHS